MFGACWCTVNRGGRQGGPGTRPLPEGLQEWLPNAFSGRWKRLVGGFWRLQTDWRTVGGGVGFWGGGGGAAPEREGG